VSVRIHPTALVDPGARLGVDVSVGPGSIVGPDVTLGDRTRIDAHALVTGWTTLGAGNHVHHGAVLGSPPQDLKYSGRPSYLVIGDRNVFREYVTANLATEPGETTRIGGDGLFMAYAHVAHNCAIGDRVVIANAVQLAGYVVVDDWAIVGGGTVVHQFTRIGRHCMIGGGSRVSQDIAPFVKSARIVSSSATAPPQPRRWPPSGASCPGSPRPSTSRASARPACAASRADLLTAPGLATRRGEHP